MLPHGLKALAVRTLPVLFAVAATLGTARAGDYRLKVGDTLDFGVVGVSLSRRLTIDLDGRISVPLGGEMAVAGSTVSEVLAQLRQTLPSKSLNIRSLEGRDNITVIAPEEISLSVAEYTAVFLNGDVAKPGAQAFRPGLTVRQAISLAGGYDLLRFRVDNPTLGGIDLQDDYRSASAELERHLAALALGNAELKRQVPAAKPIGLPSPLSAETRRDIAAAEAAKFRAKSDAYRSQRASLEKSLAGDEENIKVLTAQRKIEDDNYKADVEEAERIAELFRKGTVPTTRVGEMRRLTLLSATRVLQVAAQLEASQRQRLLTLRDLDHLDGERRTELVTGVQESETNARKLESRLQAIWDKLLFTTAMRSQLAGGGRGTARLEIVRTENGEAHHIRADEDTALEPADVVEVRLSIDPAQFEARN